MGHRYPARILCDIIHLETAKMIDDYGYLEDFYHGRPVITSNKLGKGKAYYIATSSDESFRQAFLAEIMARSAVHPIIYASEGVEITTRENDEATVLYILNHGDGEGIYELHDEGMEIINGIEFGAGMHKIAPKDVHIIKTMKS